MNSNSNNFREMFWDESNRLRVVYDQNSYQMQHYIYDAAGERTLKASSKIENVYENGQVESNNTTMGLYTTYVSPYMVVDANQKYSKHYFNGTQRVASKIGEQDIAIFENGNQYLKQTNSKAAENTPSTDFDTLKNKQITDFSYYLSKSTNNTTAKNLKVNYTEYKKVDTNTETTSAKAADNNSAFAAQQYAEIYYYHSDHLGTGTFLSDFDGNPYQFFLNLPFGETMAEQHSYSGDYTNRYKFNGKELDEETGFYYYGARYYNPKFSIWLSTDPLAEKYPSISPYAYVANNPIMFIDPDGMQIEYADDPNKTNKENRQLKREFKRSQRELNRKSSEAKNNWDTLKNSKNVHTIHLNEKSENGNLRYETVPKGGYKSGEGNGGGTDIYIDLADNTIQGEDLGTNIVGIGHEEGHAFRFDQGLVAEAKLPSIGDPNGFDNFNLEIGRIKVTEEIEASHIENIIRAEIDPTGTKIPLRQTYDNIDTFRKNFINGKVESAKVSPSVIRKGYDYYKKKK